MRVLSERKGVAYCGPRGYVSSAESCICFCQLTRRRQFQDIDWCTKCLQCQTCVRISETGRNQGPVSNGIPLQYLTRLRQSQGQGNMCGLSHHIRRRAELCL